MVADGRGNLHLNTIGYDRASETPKPGTIILVTAYGSIR